MTLPSIHPVKDLQVLQQWLTHGHCANIWLQILLCRFPTVPVTPKPVISTVKPYWRIKDDIISPSYISSSWGYHLVKIILNMCSLVLGVPPKGVQSASLEILLRSVTKNHYYYTKQSCRSPGSAHPSGLKQILTNFKEHLFYNGCRPVLRQTKIIFSAMIYKIVNTVKVSIHNIKICHL